MHEVMYTSFTSFNTTTSHIHIYTYTSTHVDGIHPNTMCLTIIHVFVFEYFGYQIHTYPWIIQYISATDAAAVWCTISTHISCTHMHAHVYWYTHNTASLNV